MGEHTTPEPQLNRAGRRLEARRLRKTGALLAAFPAAMGTTAAVLTATSGTAAAATLTVTKLDDTNDGTCDNDCSLREALDNAGDGDTIVFDSGLSGTINLNSELLVDHAVDLQGPGAATIAVDGQDNNRIFYINLAGPGTEVTISGLTLKQGSTSSNGGAIYDVDADLVLTDVIVTGNTAGGDGGAISGDNSAIDLTINTSTFSDNYASGYGGAIAFDVIGSLTISGSTFTDNTAYEGEGGAVYLYETDGAVTITGSTFSQNRSRYDDGGALRFDSGFSTSSSITITGSTFTDNRAGSDGGAVAIDGDGAVAVTSSTFTGNYAYGEGGAIYDDGDNHTVTISGSRIADNTADGGGGGLAFYYADNVGVAIQGSEITGNSSTDGYGGGVYAGSSDNLNMVVAFSTIAGNSASDDGGGIMWYEIDGGNLGVFNSTVSGNSATDGAGIYFSTSNYETTLAVANSTISGNTAAERGGGIWFGGYYGAHLIQSTITANVAPRQGGGVFIPTPEQEVGAEAKAKTAGGGRGGRDGERRGEQAAPEAGGGRVRSAAPNYGQVYSTGSIVALNSVDDVGGTGTFHAASSLFGTLSGTTLDDQGGNLVGVDPKLGALADNGGPTLTHELLSGSPAINAGPDPVPDFPDNENDQRGPGYDRVVGGRVDIGAFEVQATAIPIEPTFTG